MSSKAESKKSKKQESQESEEESSFDLLRLPNQLIRLIARFLDSKSARSMARSSRLILKVVSLRQFKSYP